MDPKKLPTKKMPNAAPERKIYSTGEVEEPKLQETPQTKKGDLAFLRSQGYSKKLKLSK